MKKVLSYLALGMMLVGCSVSRKSIDSEVLEFVNINKGIHEDIEEFAFNETQLQFKFISAKYRKAKTVQTDRIFVSLQTLNHPIIYTDIIIDVTSKEVKKDILRSNVSPYLRFESTMLKEKSTIKLINFVYVQIYGDLYKSILDINQGIGLRSSRPLVVADLKVSKFNENALLNLKSLYNQGKFQLMSNEVMKSLQDLLGSSWLVTSDQEVGGIVTQSKSKVYISIEMQTENIDEVSLLQITDDWFNSNVSFIPNDITHVLTVYKKGMGEVERIDFIYELEDGKYKRE